MYKPDSAYSPLAFGTQLLGKDGSKAFFPIPYCFMSKLESSQQEECCNVTKAQLVAQSAQQDLKHDIGEHLDKVEGCASPFVEGATAILAAKHGIAQARCALQAGGAG